LIVHDSSTHKLNINAEKLLKYNVQGSPYSPVKTNSSRQNPVSFIFLFFSVLPHLSLPLQFYAYEDLLKAASGSRVLPKQNLLISTVYTIAALRCC